MSSFYAELEVAGQTYPAGSAHTTLSSPPGSVATCATACCSMCSTCPTMSTADAAERAPLLAQHAALEATLRNLAPMHNALRAG